MVQPSVVPGGAEVAARHRPGVQPHANGAEASFHQHEVPPEIEAGVYHVEAVQADGEEAGDS